MIFKKCGDFDGYFAVHLILCWVWHNVISLLIAIGISDLHLTSFGWKNYGDGLMAQITKLRIPRNTVVSRVENPRFYFTYLHHAWVLVGITIVNNPIK